MRMEDNEIGRLHAKRPQYQAAVGRSLAIIRRALASYPTMFVSFSCGKDSAVMFDLVREVNPAVEGRFLRWPETPWLDDYDRVLEAWEARGATVRVVDAYRDRLSDRVPGRWSMLTDAAPAFGAFVGLRSAESRHRQIVIAQFGPLHVSKSGAVQCWPIGHWTQHDIAARVWQRDLPILSKYDDGIGHRTSARIPREGARDQMLAELRERNPGAYAVMRGIYPDLV